MGLERKDLTLCERSLRTILLYGGFLCLGMCFSVVGPTLQDLAFKLNTNTSNMATIYTARSGGLIIGCLIGGLLLERFHRVRVLAVSYFCSGVFTGLLPWCASLELLIGVMLLNGINMGMVDTASTVWCLDLWRVKPGPFVHALHFSFSVGTFIAPLIAEPFLIPTQITNTRAANFNETKSRNLKELLMQEYEANYYEEISYGVIGLFMAAIGIVTFAVSLVNSADPKRVPEQHHSNPKLQPWPTRLLVAAIILLVLLHFLIYGGIEIAYGQLIATYAVVLQEGQRLSKSAASFLTSGFWGAFMLGRGASIFLSHFVKNFTLIIVDHVIIVAACFSLMLFAAQSLLVLWLGTIMFGLEKPSDRSDWPNS
ncbi:sodium-dependent glucose transporter 1A-like isoform X3 [Varroa jacobsoni]|uniref:Uncharacterized protein n=1 Tax=Varroa destructor TaxID=109461 RepID=A0A7M7J8M9_VARDE|nr:sodium-dependent glucose transporter 1A-like isoform X3 [Varroa destructor]XP_022689571.1 sodium-dependent glucose transporter 1A-like isoform X3 [Varroa jacobsoni]